MRELGGEIRSIPQDSIKAGHQGGGVDHNVSSGREIRIGAIVTHHANFRTRGLGEGADKNSIFRTCSDPVRLFWYQDFNGAGGKSQLLMAKVR